jgi:hypothetical protein
MTARPISAGAEIDLLHQRITGQIDRGARPGLPPTCSTVAKSANASASSIDCAASRIVSRSPCNRPKVSSMKTMRSGSTRS